MKTNKFVKNAKNYSTIVCFFFLANQWIIKLINKHYCSSRVNYAHHNVVIPLNMETHHPSVIVKQCIWELKSASTVSHWFSKLYKQEAVEGKCCVSCFLSEGAERGRPVLPLSQQSFVGWPQTHCSNYNRPGAANSLNRTSITSAFFRKDPILPGDSTWQKRLINWLFGKWPTNVTTKKDS